MNQGKNYRRSRFRNLSESISVNLPLSVCSSLAIPPKYLKNASFLCLGKRAHHWPRIPGHLMLSILKNPLCPVAKRSYAAAYSRPLKAFLAGSPRRRTSTLLRRATPQRGVLRRCMGALLSFSFSSLLRVFPSRYLASFLLIISPCLVKHYNMED